MNWEVLLVLGIFGMTFLAFGYSVGAGTADMYWAQFGGKHVIAQNMMSMGVLPLAIIPIIAIASFFYSRRASFTGFGRHYREYHRDDHYDVRRPRNDTEDQPRGTFSKRTGRFRPPE